MTLLDEARKLLDAGPCFYSREDSNNFCAFCGEEQLAPVVVHAPSCQWLAMPRIVAALEALHRVYSAAHALTLGVEYQTKTIEPLLVDLEAAVMQAQETLSNHRKGRHDATR